MLLATALLTSAAHAAPTIHGEAVATMPLDENGLDLGIGTGLRVGVPLGLVGVHLVPEAGLTLWPGAGTLIVPEVGARVRFGKLIEPGAYAHALFPLGDTYQTGWDAGLSLDVTAVPKLDLGLQAGVMDISGAFVPTLGLSAGLRL